MPRKVFTAGEVLAASDVNNFLMDQTIMTFAGTAARGSAIGTATEGMYAHLNDTDELTYWDGSAWVNRIGAAAGILQVVSVTKTDGNFTMASTTFADVTGLSATITPSSATSKIYVMASVSVGATVNTNSVGIRLMRASTAIAIGDAAGSRTPASAAAEPAGNALVTLAVDFLDSPATTSATTYKVQIRSNTANTVSVNRSITDPDAGTTHRTVSTITIMEVAG